MHVKISTTLVAVTAAVLISGCSGAEAERGTQGIPGPPPWKSVPTFSTENIGRQGHFYVGGKWDGKPGEERMRGSERCEGKRMHLHAGTLALAPCSICGHPPIADPRTPASRPPERQVSAERRQ